MEQTLNFWLLGGDRRFTILAQQLAADGHRVNIYAPVEETIPPSHDFSQLAQADCVIFPLPIQIKGHLNAPFTDNPPAISDLFAQLTPEQMIFGGNIDSDTHALAKRHSLTLHDYYRRDELAIANAVPTAEGAVQIAMEQLPFVIHSAPVLILGYGRVGRVTAQRFAALGAKVTVAARNPAQRAWAQADGFTAQPLSAPLPATIALVINTIPAQILKEEQLKALPPDILILDLASLPGGVDLQAAHRLNRWVLQAPGLPGKVAPVTVAAALKSTIYTMLTELGALRPGKEGHP